MKILILFGGNLSLGWGRAQNLAKSFGESNNEVVYLNQLKFGFKNIFKPKNHNNIVELPNCIGLPIVRFSSLTLIQNIIMRIFLMLNKKLLSGIDLIIFYGVPHPSIQKLILDNVNHKKVIYDCADEKETIFNDLVNKKTGQLIRDWELDLIKKMDSIVVITQQLKETLQKKTNKEIIVIDNGIDNQLFNRKESVSDKNKSIIYAGAINNRIDFESLAFEINKNPELTIDFYGNYYEPLIHLTKHNEQFNYKGYVNYFELPKIMKDYSFGLVPCKNIESIRNSSPLKIYQYLSCGLRVLALPYDNQPIINGIYQFKNLQHIDKLSEDIISDNEMQQWYWSYKIELYIKHIRSL